MSGSERIARFQDRHIGPSEHALTTMLMSLGFKDLDSFAEVVVPDSIRTLDALENHLPQAIGEHQVLNELKTLASRNKNFTSLIGNGYFGTLTPPVIVRNLLENPAWYTAYTPYQPEISQGRLEALFAFQTMITDLTGLSISNASMLDEPTAAAEAMTLARRSWQGDDDAPIMVEAGVNPQTIAVLETRARPLGIAVVQFSLDNPIPDLKPFAVLVQSPDTHGVIHDLESIRTYTEKFGSSLIVATDLLALTLMKSPGEYKADIAVGSAQRFGVPMGFGGPHAGFLAVRDGLERSLPGRLVGMSVDSHGNPALRLALQTREQHIRRDRATSNICTAQVLLANIAAMYAAYHGPSGLRAIAKKVHDLATTLQQSLIRGGYKVRSGNFFDTVSIVTSSQKSDVILERAREMNYNLRKTDSGLNISFDETCSEDTLEDLASIFEVEVKSMELTAMFGAPRTTDFLTHPIFNTYHSETSMMRYLRSLADRDLALDRSMIPLGSCTMKLNAAMEMEAVTWPEFANLHPFAPNDQSAGTRQLIAELSTWLISITGYDAVSLQPNAGSQGEFAGLLAIKNYLESIGESGRDICLIPSSAHGTNAASAVMAGMKVVVIDCDERGNVSLEHLERSIAEYGSRLAALMVTYPSTHGVFESEITKICAMVHEAGGQVYVDGANLNALVGVAQPGKFGADVSHLNLHKTFCIPHGGGGPGVGPVIAKSHLAPFLPNHPLDHLAGPQSGPGPISGAPFGSAGILPISWAYIRAMGGDGLRRATQVAILSANYIANRLEDAFPILYRGESGFIAHECIIDIREITKRTGVTVDDIAKRLMDYGFHAPTMSFPVAGTLMIEPTESEDIYEIERFISAMLAIREEISEIERGEIAVDQSALRNAPHTLEVATATQWDRPYSREKAISPMGNQVGLQRRAKYWPTVGRIDGAYGDRNLVCACEPVAQLAINR
ncbi:MAG: aminomethyl-transferring glycine dehydrogenase [Candidatus Nanopelagicaceae bacterium]